MSPRSLWSLVMDKMNSRPEEELPSKAVELCEGGHDHLRIIRHVLDRCAIPLRGRNPTILKQSRGVKEVRATHTNTYNQPEQENPAPPGALL